MLLNCLWAWLLTSLLYCLQGLLQSEVEGVDNENVGFYGRCELHATQHQHNFDHDPSDIDTNYPGEKKLTCARTEVCSPSVFGKSDIQSFCTQYSYVLFIRVTKAASVTVFGIIILISLRALVDALFRKNS